MSPPWAPHGAEDYARVIADHLPTGTAWPRDADADLMKWVDGNAQVWGTFDARAADLLITESDPRSTLELLPDWERAYGLPDPCSAETPTVADRRAALVNRLVIVGRQDRNFFISLAAAIGYAITIQEYSPVMCGLSQCGDTRSLAPNDPGDVGFRWQIGPPEMRFVWTVRVAGRRVSWFRCGSGQCGLDPMVRIGLATDLECVIRRWAPAHKQVVFDYSAAAQPLSTYAWFRCGQSHVGQDPMLTIVVDPGGTDDTAGLGDLYPS